MSEDGRIDTSGNPASVPAVGPRRLSSEEAEQAIEQATRDLVAQYNAAVLLGLVRAGQGGLGMRLMGGLAIEMRPNVDRFRQRISEAVRAVQT
jgi:hypothetical protein